MINYYVASVEFLFLSLPENLRVHFLVDHCNLITLFSPVRTLMLNYYTSPEISTKNFRILSIFKE